MSLWPFSKNKKHDPRYADTDVRSDGEPWDDEYAEDYDYDEDSYDDYGEYSDEYDDDFEDSYDDDSEAYDDYSGALDYDPEDGDTGPFDGDTIAFEEFDFSDFSSSTLDLGSLKIPLPKHSEVQVEMDGTGPRMLHIVTPYGRITPVAFAAPRSEGQWRQTTKELAEGMRNDGLMVHIEHGPWGREIVGLAPEATIRIIGADGPRWMLRMTLAAPNATADEMTELGRDVVARTFVYRGEDPIFAGQPLPVALPDKLARQVQQAMEKRTKSKKADQENNEKATNDAASTQQQQPARAAAPTAKKSPADKPAAPATTTLAAPTPPSADATQVMPRQESRSESRGTSKEHSRARATDSPQPRAQGGRRRARTTPAATRAATPPPAVSRGRHALGADTARQTPEPQQEATAATQAPSQRTRRESAPRLGASGSALQQMRSER